MIIILITKGCQFSPSSDCYTCFDIQKWNADFLWQDVICLVPAQYSLTLPALIGQYCLNYSMWCWTKRLVPKINTRYDHHLDYQRLPIQPYPQVHVLCTPSLNAITRCGLVISFHQSPPVLCFRRRSHRQAISCALHGCLFRWKTNRLIRSFRSHKQPISCA